MAEEAPSSRLGRGLAALIGDVGDEMRSVERGARPAPACRSSSCGPNPRNPRKHFDESELDELAAVDPRARHHPADPGAAAAGPAGRATRSSPASGAGARRSGPACTRCRWWSSRSTTGPRSNSRSSRTSSAPTSTPIEEAQGYQRLMAEFGYTQADLAEIIGKSRSHIANTLRLLKLPESRARRCHRQRRAHGRPCPRPAVGP